jgi:hypothetical protein
MLMLIFFSFEGELVGKEETLAPTALPLPRCMIMARTRTLHLNSFNYRSDWRLAIPESADQPQFAQIRRNSSWNPGSEPSALKEMPTSFLLYRADRRHTKIDTALTRTDIFTEWIILEEYSLASQATKPQNHQNLISINS